MIGGRCAQALGAVVAGAVLLGCGSDSDADEANAEYCGLLEKSIDAQAEIGPAGPTPDQVEQLSGLAVELRESAPDELQSAYDDLDAALAPDAAAPGRREALDKHSRVLGDWAEANC